MPGLFHVGAVCAQDAGHAAPVLIQASIDAPNCACVPGVGERVPDVLRLPFTRAGLVQA